MLQPEFRMVVCVRVLFNSYSGIFVVWRGEIMEMRDIQRSARINMDQKVIYGQVLRFRKNEFPN